MARPIIALLTDFGLRDHYAAAMKGVALGICPEATLVDISHEIPPQDILSGALELSACYRYFPDETVFLVVIDPGVGSRRRALAARVGGYRFAYFEGAPADLFVSADQAQMNILDLQKLIIPQTRRVIVSNKLVVVVPRNAPPIGPYDLTGSRVHSIALADTRAVPAGVYAKAWLQLRWPRC